LKEDLDGMVKLIDMIEIKVWELGSSSNESMFENDRTGVGSVKGGRRV
jgi:hypothetical protein